jgi:Uma2 family endonuclease
MLLQDLKTLPRSQIDAPALNEWPIVLRFLPLIELSDDEFYEFCRLNRDLRIERTANGEVIIMKPAGGEAGGRNLSLAALLWIWARNDGRGVAFDSSTGFVLPNGATRSPDASWVRREKLATLRREEKQRFLPLCPDFVVELRSPSDRVADLQAKMEEYIANGAQLGWLLVPETRTVLIYRPDAEPMELVDPVQLTGDLVLPGFVLVMKEVWDPGF